MSNEIKKYEPNYWLKVTASSPAELSKMKQEGLVPRTGIRQMARLERDTLRNEIMEMVKRVAVLSGNESLRSMVIVDELITLFEENDQIYGLTLADAYLAFKRGVAGQYGKVYGNVKYMDLVSWLKEYENERVLAIEEAARVGKPVDSYQRGKTLRDYLRPDN